MLPIPGRLYGCSRYDAEENALKSRPYGEARTRWRYSSSTTARSDLKFASSTLRFIIRSASAQSSVSRWFDGTTSWYSVTSSPVDALLAPPTSSVRRSNCSARRFAVLLNIMCSKRWAKPERPGGSSRLPTWYATCTLTVGLEWVSTVMTCRPLARRRSR